MSSNNRFDVITIFPDYLTPIAISLMGKAAQAGLVDISIQDLREYATNIHRSVDDTPYGGGAGMVMSPQPWGEAIDAVAERDGAPIHDLIVLTPAGEKFTQKLAEELVNCEHVIFACGRYEGIDHRVTEHYQSRADFRVREVSIGDYVLGGGEVAALVILEAVIRLIPGVLGNPDSLREESHSMDGSMVEYPNFTKPALWRELAVPEVLLSGNHAAIAKWRLDQAVKRTNRVHQQTRE